MIRNLSVFLIISILAGCLSSDAVSAAPKETEKIFTQENLVLIRSGDFMMGDHHNLGGREHKNDEIPVHRVVLDAFFMGRFEVTNKEYTLFLNAQFNLKRIEMKEGRVYENEYGKLLCDTKESEPGSSILFDGAGFGIIENRENHPAVGIRWLGAAAYCNWLSLSEGLEPCYDLKTEACDFFRQGYRLPTEAEWEYAGRGGLYEPYVLFPWGDEADNRRANWPKSGDPFENSSLAATTPVGFYNGQTHKREEFNWPGSAESYTTLAGSNGYGLFDMAGNVWEWTGDIYNRDYYANSPLENPRGPEKGSPMPDGKIYHTLRGGNWYNGEWGHSRVSNRDPAYFRGPDDPNHAWYHIGFRIVLPVTDKREVGK